ncbi:hypothetical protein [Pseudomonas sp. ANT_H12B]|uniref:hypothetical protein n=1 Tax=Pseudomonas sp. ANT_H12B TaxID=2597348 RepID=UPI0011EE5860|nr:hypothetical protein [Pseudomonas sp. ANT_H12B]KAA0964294.1 hypothetical protein FQ185_23235 [Pseudomonas sp. ANT_H12B]
MHQTFRSAPEPCQWASCYQTEQTSFFTSIEQQLGNGWSGKIELTHAENKFDEVFNYSQSGRYSVYGTPRNVMTSFKYDC